jgi:hypothetical protein
MSRNSTIVLTLALVVSLSGLSSAEDKLVRVMSYDVPLLGRPVNSIEFDDIDGDGNAEILASDGFGVILFSSTMDSVLLHEQRAAGTGRFDDLELADVNRDSIADVVIGVFCTGWGVNICSSLVICHDGASSYATADTAVGWSGGPPFGWVSQ